MKVQTSLLVANKHFPLGKAISKPFVADNGRLPRKLRATMFVGINCDCILNSSGLAPSLAKAISSLRSQKSA